MKKEKNIVPLHTIFSYFTLLYHLANTSQANFMSNLCHFVFILSKIKTEINSILLTLKNENEKIEVNENN